MKIVRLSDIKAERIVRLSEIRLADKKQCDCHAPEATYCRERDGR